MSKRFTVGAICVAVLSLAGWALAQQDQPVPKKAEAEGARFMVAPAGSSAVLLETATGKTWVLHQSSGGPSCWIPAIRLERQEDFQAWQEKEREKQEIERKKQIERISVPKK
jgi:hypothetical protein